MDAKPPTFISYCREDSAFALRLAEDLKAAGADVWLDQLDIRPGKKWDLEVQRALTQCREMLVILSPASVCSDNVLDEVAYALDEEKTIIPAVASDCPTPYRLLRRLQRVDLRKDYELGLKALLRELVGEPSGAAPADSVPPLQENTPARETSSTSQGGRARVPSGKTHCNRENGTSHLARCGPPCDSDRGDAWPKGQGRGDQSTTG